MSPYRSTIRGRIRIGATLVAGTALAGWAVAPSPARASAGPVAHVAVTMDRMFFPDGIYRASFSVKGACVSPTDDVQVSRRRCGPGARSAAGTLRGAKLGFDALLSTEAGPVDVPIVEYRQAAVPEQFDSVHVELREAGDLTVQMSGAQTGDVDPSPIAGSASAGGTISGRSVTWNLPGLPAGAYDFSVLFDPGATAGFDGTFAPKVTVTRRASSSTLLEFEAGSVGTNEAATVTSTLTIVQHVEPAAGAPEGTTARYFAARGSEKLPHAWETSATLDATGAYQATVSGPVSVTSAATLAKLAPKALGVANTAVIASTRPYIPGDDKIGVYPLIDLTTDNKPAGFRFVARTADPTDTFSGLTNGPTCGTFFDGDATSSTAGASIGTVASVRQGTPDNPGGTIRPAWGGGMAGGWSGLWANDVPNGEPNALNHAAYLRDIENAILKGAGYAGYGPYAVLHQWAAAIPMVASGGDVDNRAGTADVVGAPATLTVPGAETLDGALIFTVSSLPTHYGFDLKLDGAALTITPKVGPGGYWLQSSGSGYDRDWSNLHLVTVSSTEKDRDFDLPLQTVTSASAVIPAGSRGRLDALDRLGHHRHFDLGPGLWKATLSPAGVTVVRLGA